MTAIELLVFVCAVCGNTDAQCPVCVNTIAIDPETGLPPDVGHVNGKAASKTPSEAARLRAEQQPLCDMCIAAAINKGAKNLITAADRHSRTHEHVL